MKEQSHNIRLALYRHCTTYAISDLAFFLKVKENIINILEISAKFSLREWKRYETKVAEEYCWAITHKV